MRRSTCVVALTIAMLSMGPLAVSAASGRPLRRRRSRGRRSGCRSTTRTHRSRRGSPDGTKIAYEHWQDAHNDLYTANADGTSVTDLTNGGITSPQHPTWSPDGMRMAFHGWEAGDQIFVMNADGSAITDITAGTYQNEYPAWSPNGLRIAFERGSGFDTLVLTMRPDGTGQTQIADLTGVSGWPAWSPDGSMLAVMDNHRIGIMKANGTGLTDIPIRVMETKTPAWSPDGTRIAFFGVPYSGPNAVFSVGLDGSGLEDGGHQRRRRPTDVGVQPVHDPRNERQRSAGRNPWT
jgi:Tol biopolymer transport system component